jgi:hypothetical protein
MSFPDERMCGTWTFFKIGSRDNKEFTGTVLSEGPTENADIMEQNYSESKASRILPVHFAHS